MICDENIPHKPAMEKHQYVRHDSSPKPQHCGSAILSCNKNVAGGRKNWRQYFAQLKATIAGHSGELSKNKSYEHVVWKRESGGERLVIMKNQT